MIELRESESDRMESLSPTRGDDNELELPFHFLIVGNYPTHSW